MTPSAFRHSRPVRMGLAVASATTLALAVAVGAVLAWTAPSLQALCASDESHYSWQITLTHEPDYLIQLSWSSDFSGAWLVDFGSSGSHQFDTDRGGSTLYARWKNDTAKKTSASADEELCYQPTPTPEESVSPSESASPTPSETASPTPVVTPTPTPVVTPTPTPVVTPTPTPVVTPSETPSETASPTPVVTPTPTPEQSIAGSTGTPAPTIPNTALGEGQSQLAVLSLPLMVLFGGVLLASLMLAARTRRR